jgi:hypothetical protein
VGSTYSFVPVAHDPDTSARRLRFYISNRPSWATFSSRTGALQGTPTSAGSWANIVIAVSDGFSTASLPAFSIAALAANSPPRISGTPASLVLANSAYRFDPTASDPDGDALSFTIQNAPSWLSFSSDTGALSGTPAAADVGTYSNIVISVSDGTQGASLPAFAITVSDVANGTATLNWTPPTTNTDGSELTDLSGYSIYYGTNANDLSTVIQLNDPGLSTYVIDGLASGTYYFAMTARAASGAESEKSQIASKTIE